MPKEAPSLASAGESLFQVSRLWRKTGRGLRKVRGGRSVFQRGQVREIVKAKQNTVKPEAVPFVS